jgi:hypothetical protein
VSTVADFGLRSGSRRRSSWSTVAVRIAGAAFGRHDLAFSRSVFPGGLLREGRRGSSIRRPVPVENAALMTRRSWSVAVGSSHTGSFGGHDAQARPGLDTRARTGSTPRPTPPTAKGDATEGTPPARQRLLSPTPTGLAHTDCRFHLAEPCALDVGRFHQGRATSTGERDVCGMASSGNLPRMSRRYTGHHKLEKKLVHALPAIGSAPLQRYFICMKDTTPR